ncbi:MAG TPA: hypothetical protein PLZ77_02980, partial [Lachnospiraceae bacterium]|nr:hypothetical protein [Lachnospiraceae bacterium]
FSYLIILLKVSSLTVIAFVFKDIDITGYSMFLNANKGTSSFFLLVSAINNMDVSLSSHGVAII